MSVLFFPDVNALRLALASGLVGPDISRSPAEVGYDANGSVWVEPTTFPSRECLPALARLGVRALGDSGMPTSHVNCWAELIPLQPNAISTARCLFLVPEQSLAGFVSRIKRPVGVVLPDVGPPGRAWVVVDSPPPRLVAECADPDPPFELYVEQAPSVWVRYGWSHPLAEHLVVPADQLLLLAPPRVVLALRAVMPSPALTEFQLPRPHLPPAAGPTPHIRVPIRLTLAARGAPARESLWVFDRATAAEFWKYCAAADEGQTRRLEVATVSTGSDTRLVVRTNPRHPIVLPFTGCGYSPDPCHPGLYVPDGKAVRPALRTRELATAFGLRPGRLVWVEEGTDRLTPHAVPESAFRPVADLLEYTVPATAPLTTDLRREPFPLARFVAQAAPPPSQEPELDVSGSEDAIPGEEVGPPGNDNREPGWFLRSLRNLVSRVRQARNEPTQAMVHQNVGRVRGRVGGKVDRKIGTPDSLLHGSDRAARRRELEGRLFGELPHSGPAGRAERWADLAAAYAVTGNALDAAVCWLNAAWECPAPRVDYLDQWLAAECRAARTNLGTEGPERWVSETSRPGIGRVVAAYLTRVGFSPPPDIAPILPRLLAVLEQNFDDVPVRGAWLARLGAARVCDGDALGIARWRDRIVSRLTERGPGLDLDEPSFLRFHKTASAERFQTAREWLVRVRESVLQWVKRQGAGRLPWAGLDAETDATAAHAQFMLAWGLACLGERTRSKDWSDRARKALAGAAGFRADPSAHALLGHLFQLRVRDAQEGRRPRPGLPPDLQTRAADLTDHGAYAVQRLREHSRILEPLDRPRAYRGTDLKVFWGTDRLGERLSVLAAGSDPTHLAAEADDLLELCSRHPATETLPRIVLTLLDQAARLDLPTLVRLLDLLPVAIDWTEPLLVARQWAESERPATLVRFASRMLDSALGAAGAQPPDQVAPAVRALVRRLAAGGGLVRASVGRVSETVFRTLRRLGLNDEVGAFLRVLDPDPGAPLGDRLAAACGWLLTGDDDAASGTLDEAREALFREAGSDARAPAQLAVGYAAALGFAAPRVALGRLEELFQRLGRLDPSGANSHFTLAPLKLIDTVVRSVVTDEFALGPSVRRWLDDDEFLIRTRVHRDMAAVLREQNLG